MKNLLIFIIPALLLVSCTSKRYLAVPGTLGINTHGAFIKIKKNDHEVVKGEIISVSDSAVFVLPGGKGLHVVTVGKNDIKKYKVKCADGKSYWWSVPTYAISSIAHGFFGLATFPINLITTLSVSFSGSNAYKYDDEEMAFTQLYQFARFPQGLPPGVKPGDIQPRSEKKMPQNK